MRLALAASLLLFATIAQAEDWPQWRGPNSSGNYTEPGLIEEAPQGGLQQKWRLDCGYGYAGPAVAGAGSICSTM